MLASVAEFYEDDVNTHLANMVAVIEPAILIFMAIVIAFILISLYLPMFSLSVGGPGIGIDSYEHNRSNTSRRRPIRRASARNRSRLAERYRCPFVDLFEQRIDPELFRSIPAELMFRFNFVPMEARTAPW